MKKHGGNRKNSGRKPVSDKKGQVSLYIEQSKIKKLGGIDELKDKCYKFVDRTVLRS